MQDMTCIHKLCNLFCAIFTASQPEVWLCCVGIPVSSKSAYRHPSGSWFKPPPGTLTQQHVQHLVHVRALCLVRHDDGLVDVKVQDQAGFAGKLLCQNDAWWTLYKPAACCEVWGGSL